MRSRIRDRQKVWFCNVNECQDSIDTVLAYSKPEIKKMNVSESSGSVSSLGSGFQLDYSKTITCFQKSFYPEVGTRVFVDVVPKLDKDGLLAKNENGDYITEPDYLIRRIIDNQKGIVKYFMLEKM